MATAKLYAVTRIKHNGSVFEPGEVVQGLDKASAEQLLATQSVATVNPWADQGELTQELDTITADLEAAQKRIAELEADLAAKAKAEPAPKADGK